MIKDLKMELLNSEETQKIQGGECELEHMVIVHDPSACYNVFIPCDVPHNSVPTPDPQDPIPMPIPGGL